MDNLKYYLELSNEKHHKFYELTLSFNVVSVTYGRIGRDGRVNLKYFPTIYESIQFFYKQLNKKIKRGYHHKIKGLTAPKSKCLNYNQLSIPFEYSAII